MFKQSCTTEQGKYHLVTNKISNSNDNNNRCTCMSMEERQWLFLPSYLFKRKNTKTSSTWGMNILCKWRLPICTLPYFYKVCILYFLRENLITLSLQKFFYIFSACFPWLKTKWLVLESSENKQVIEAIFIFVFSTCNFQ